MKWFILFLLFIANAAAATFKVTEVVVNCAESDPCTERKARFSNLAGDYRSLVHLKDTLRVMASDGGYRMFTYDIYREGENNSLHIDFELKPLIKEVNIGFTDRNLEADPLQLVTVKEGEAFEIQKLEESITGMKQKLEALGYPDNKIEYSFVERGTEVSISAVVTLGAPRIFKNINSDARSAFLKPFIQRKFVHLYNKPFDFNRFKVHLDEAQKELFNYGYYLINLEFTPVIKDHRVTLMIKVRNEQLFAFDFQGMVHANRSALYSIVTDLFRKYKRPVTEGVIKQSLEEHYRKLALLAPEISFTQQKYQNLYHEAVTLYRINVKEGEKTQLKQLTFSGSSFYPPEKLRKYFDNDAFELASVGYYDEDYYDYFAGDLKSKYLQKGFVQVRVQGPVKTIPPDKKTASVEYSITEGPRAYIRSIDLDGLPLQYEPLVLKELENKVNEPFNPLVLVEDFKRIATTLQENGFYYAEVTNTNDDNVVKYNRSGTEVDIKVVLNTGPLLRLNRIILLGNNKTRKKVIMKKVSLEEGDLITPAKTRDIESALAATGLFNTVEVIPLRHNSKKVETDLVIRVSEREYGLVEIAPGYRSDIGIKLTGTVSYLNIGGRNIGLTLRSQVNQRLSYQAFDPRRRKEQKSFLEYNNTATLNMGDIANSLVDYSAGLTFQKKRFYSFDADIQRINNTFTRDLTKKLSASVRHQYEIISQYDATDDINNDSYQIGGITPSITYDLRNSQVNPMKGAFFNLSCEFANPYFGSQQKSDLTVNYYKLISRNRFYIPISKYGTIAISLVGGIQENLAKDLVRDSAGNPEIVDGQKKTEGIIPTFKLFRLTGMDIVRGFSDEEINKLSDRRDISQARVQDKAYLANFKLEPRFFVSDNFIAGVFLDAGRVYVDQFDLGDLRSSTGVTFKILTPVGTLDFDYGIKLLRKKNANGTLEDPGRFHVSIGFF